MSITRESIQQQGLTLPENTPTVTTPPPAAEAKQPTEGAATQEKPAAPVQGAATETKETKPATPAAEDTWTTKWKEHFPDADPETVKGKLTAAEKADKEFQELKGKYFEVSEREKSLLQASRRGVNLHTFEKLQSADTKKLKDTDAIRLQLEYERPNLNDAQVKAILKRDHKIGLTEDEAALLSDEDKLLLEADLQDKGAKAKAWIESQKAKDLETVKQPAQNEKEQAEAFAKFQDGMSKAAKSIESVQVKLDDNTPLNHKVDANEMKALASAVLLNQNGVYVVNEKLLGDQAQLLNTLYKGLNADKIIKEAAETIRKQETEKAEAKFNNKQPFTEERKPGGAAKTYETKAAAATAAHFAN